MSRSTKQSSSEVHVKRKRQPRLCQGDVFRNIEHVEAVTVKGSTVDISRIVFPLVMVLTQDCDLAQDYRVRYSRPRAENHDKALFSVLVAPMYNAEHFYLGEHLSELELRMRRIAVRKTEGSNLHNNETPRYHYLEFPDDTPLVPCVVDFKHYFSVNVEYLKKAKKVQFVCQLAALYREDVCQRFSNYMSRIGLP